MKKAKPKQLEEKKLDPIIVNLTPGQVKAIAPITKELERRYNHYLANGASSMYDCRGTILAQINYMFALKKAKMSVHFVNFKKAMKINSITVDD